ncbi:MAG: hemolysin III [Paraglaciecola sp.]|jgi:hemolysin III
MNQSTSLTKSYSSGEEWLNAASHGFGFIAAIIGLIMLLFRAEGIYAQVISIVYAVSMMMMFLSSTLYHSVRDQDLKLLLKVIDHSAIYLLIAGTYTPLMLLTVGGWLGGVTIGLIWGIALVGVLFKCFARGRFPKLSVITYLAMGWLAILFIYPLYQALPAEGIRLLVGGGLFYSIGVLFYVAKKVKYTHSIWHVFVTAGCACHFFLIYDYVV